MLENAEPKWMRYITRWIDRIGQFRAALGTSTNVFGDIVGVDIDDSSVAIIQLRNPLGTIKVSRAEVAGLPTGVISEDVIVDQTVLTNTIKKLINKTKNNVKNAAIVLPGNKVAIKKIKLESALSDDEAEVRAWQEARKTFPELAKSLFLDFVQTSEVDVSGLKKNYLILIITKKEDIGPRVEALQQAGLIVKIADVDFYALERAYSLFSSQLPQNHIEKYTALIDFNPHSILFLVMHKKQMIYSMRQVYTGDVLVPLVQQALGVEVTLVKPKPVLLAPFAIPMQAQTEVQAEALLKAEAITHVLTEEQKSHMIMTIRRLFQSFYSENTGKIIDSIAMTGRCALIPDITQHIAKSLDLAVVVANPLSSLKLGEHLDGERMIKLGPAFAVSCGLAMRGIPLWK